MYKTILFNWLIVIIGALLLAINFILAPHNPYAQKNGPFECGYSSFIGQNRTQFSISFFIFALLFLLFDLEILLVYPYTVSSYGNEGYGLTTLMIFLIALIIGFGFELGKQALSIESRQTKEAKESSYDAESLLYLNVKRKKAALISFGSPKFKDICLHSSNNILFRPLNKYSSFTASRRFLKTSRVKKYIQRICYYAFI